MPRFRKKPVEIEAVQFTRDLAFRCLTKQERAPFGLHVSGDCYPATGELLRAWVNIKTLEGVMRANLDDWIIRGVKGELYPCKPDIFATTYEPV